MGIVADAIASNRSLREMGFPEVVRTRLLKRVDATEDHWFLLDVLEPGMILRIDQEYVAVTGHVDTDGPIETIVRRAVSGSSGADHPRGADVFVVGVAIDEAGARIE